MNEFDLCGFILTVQNHVRVTWYVPVKNNQTCTHLEGLILHWYLKKYELNIGKRQFSEINY